ncbi:nucleotide exchange factor GrpE [Candidatus Daviesbacteria bacterium RIFCSPLOWO2_01_FULL_38_10]|uniref:Protein GrpE n=1 Tax=Candidatus Daviesbacteria bacterium GW2011_GWF2_38_6 TaxID=1618432 RepID=A0A0G0KIC8_9BACT|nr:MAG: Protein GrpE [Candidatus Daviesbacteria bacterium GW2011_GWF2_38_6]OGE26436.1 MAG: nucleotide exchange factor GrpE [Candidatus Daviesbacteria bacterium RIFCSPHIGHO2_02_FULL_39_41]OGE27018.1 MAG: nucleotide exchange factor GrpE [Candidatus Daviesbacteria bacterium RIFCSPHIGHO2_01_FULL_38_8b]OGE36964.1 MAG: nucleotide exchange factor GrpE [Candidatus Daviesbacteria bacterium RIFCSPLOWO2_01_FULL_38_10]OGE43825.1 MAG: nucleotide exchange factor GrpE [Candidatus Daviesbacteria bacterium RIFC
MAKKQDSKIQELENQLKRAVADYQNLEKRISEGRSELTNFMGAELIKRLLPVLDHLDKALQGVKESESQSGWSQGVEMAIKEFKQVLQSEGLEEISCEGEFNPALHEAVDTRDGNDNMILEIVKKGYNLNGKVIRPAQVVVGQSTNNNPERSLAEGGRVEGSN